MSTRKDPFDRLTDSPFLTGAFGMLLLLAVAGLALWLFGIIEYNLLMSTLTGAVFGGVMGFVIALFLKALRKRRKLSES